MSRNHLIVIYILLAILTLFTFSQKNGNATDLDDIKNRIIKVEFLQEATRIRDNLVGFKQVNASLVNDTERIKSCNESKDLLIEWSEDIKKLGSNYLDHINNNPDAKEYFDAISKLNDAIAVDCNKLTSN